MKASVDAVAEPQQDPGEPRLDHQSDSNARGVRATSR